MSDLQKEVVFDYSSLDEETSSFLKNKALRIHETTSKAAYEIGKELKEAQDKLAKSGYGFFEEWYSSLGFKKTKAYQYINHYNFVRSESEQTKIEMFESAPKSIQTEISKPSANKKVNEAYFNGDITTHKEYKEMEKKIRKKDNEIENIKQKNEELEKKLREKPEKIEVTPEDYEELKSSNQQLSNALREANRSHDLMQEQYNNLVSQQKEEDENSQKYKELSQAIQEMQGKMSRTQKLIQAQKQVYELVDMSKELLMKITPIPYLIDSELVRENPVAKRELENIANQTQSFLNNLNDALKESRIMEGEFTNAE